MQLKVIYICRNWIEDDCCICNDTFKPIIQVEVEIQASGKTIINETIPVCEKHAHKLVKDWRKHVKE